MNENHTIHLAEIPIGGKGGFIWNRLHGEREEICETLIKRCEPGSQGHQPRELPQARLRRVDDALDRLMAGSYGICSECGRAIEDATLDVDPAWALCAQCSERELNTNHDRNENELSEVEPRSELIVESLNSFDNEVAIRP